MSLKVGGRGLFLAIGRRDGEGAKGSVLRREWRSGGLDHAISTVAVCGSETKGIGSWNLR